MAKDSLIILSGGLDSTTMLYDYAANIALAITFDYQSTQNERERRDISFHCDKLRIKHLLIPVNFFHDYFKSSLLADAASIPLGKYDSDNMSSTVVPFRNGIMLSIAAGIAQSYGLSKVMIANHGGDHYVYPDCRPEFIDAMSAAVSAGTDKQVSICAPYTNLSKSDIVGRGVALGVDYSKTYSCYLGGERHCGKCATCIERREALQSAGIYDID